MYEARSRPSGARSTSLSVLIRAGGQETAPSSVMAGNLPHVTRSQNGPTIVTRSGNGPPSLTKSELNCHRTQSEPRSLRPRSRRQLSLANESGLLPERLSHLQVSAKLSHLGRSPAPVAPPDDSQRLELSSWQLELGPGRFPQRAHSHPKALAGLGYRR